MAPKELSDHPVALVTGGTRGIGLACAEALHAAGHQVAVTYRSTPPAADLAEKFLCIPCDVLDGDAVEAAVDKVEEDLGPIEVLVANAGVTADGLVATMTNDEWDLVVATNLTGTFRFVRRVVSSMGRKRVGRIILMGSVAGTTGNKGQANYAATKAGLIGLARSVAAEYARRNITVNVIAPGAIETDMLAELDDDYVASMTNKIPARRLGQSSEVAGAVVFLSGPSAGYITGAVIPVDGGLAGLVALA